MIKMKKQFKISKNSSLSKTKIFGDLSPEEQIKNAEEYKDEITPHKIQTPCLLEQDEIDELFKDNSPPICNTSNNKPNKIFIDNSSRLCQICGKPFTYIGDIIPGEPKSYCEGHNADLEIPSVYPMKMGWKCPKCGSIWSPTVSGCSKCNNQNKINFDCLNIQEVKK